MFLVVFMVGVGAGGYGYEKLFVDDCPPSQVILNSNKIRAKKQSKIDYQAASQNTSKDTTQTDGFFKRLFKNKNKK